MVYARGYNLLSRLQLSGSDETVSVVQQAQYGYFLSVYGIAGWMKDEHIRFAFFLQDGAGRDRKSILLLCTAKDGYHGVHAGRRDSPCAGYYLQAHGV